MNRYKWISGFDGLRKNDDDRDLHDSIVYNIKPRRHSTIDFDGSSTKTTTYKSFIPQFSWPQ